MSDEKVTVNVKLRFDPPLPRGMAKIRRREWTARVPAGMAEGLLEIVAELLDPEGAGEA